MLNLSRICQHSSVTTTVVGTVNVKFIKLTEIANKNDVLAQKLQTGWKQNVKETNQ